MFKLINKNQGAISIFLIIVFVPMLILSSIFVDMSRIELANSAAASAGDLALNTALTDYDTVLKDMYGLFATSQDIDELLENLEEYYRKTIESAGVSPEDVDDIVAQAMSMVKSATGTDDLMNMALADFTVTKPDDASLANPAVLKDQIIEFMKYRGPIDIGSGIFDALSSMKNLSKQTKLVDNKNKFYEQERKVLEDLENAWKEIQAYQYFDAKSLGFPTGNYIAEQSELMNDNSQKLSDSVIEDTIKYLYNYDYFKLNQCKITHEEGEDGVWTFEWFGETIKFTPEFKKDRDSVLADKVLEKVNDAMTSINQLETECKGDIYSLLTSSTSEPVAQVYKITQFNKAGKSGYSKAVKECLFDLLELQNAVDCTDVDLSDTYLVKPENSTLFKLSDESHGSLTLQTAVDTQLAHLTLDVGNDYFYLFNSYTSKLDDYYNTVKDKVNEKKDEVCKNYTKIQSDASNFYNLMTKKSNNLKNAASSLRNVLSALEKSDSAYNKALQEWSDSAKNLSDDTMGKNDKEEIEDLKKILTVDKVQSLLTRLDEAKKTIDGIITQIDLYKFNGTSFSKFIASETGYANMKALFTTDQNSAIEAIVPVAEGSYDAVINAISAEISKGSIATSWTQEDEKPDLTKGQRELYTWLYNNYYDPNATDSKSESATKAGDGKVDDSKKKMNEKAGNYTSDPNNVQNGSSTTVNRNLSNYNKDDEATKLPSNEGASKYNGVSVTSDADSMLSKSSSQTDGLLSTAISEFENMGVTLRDSIYITDYIMKMFSYDTFEAEYNNKSEDSSKNSAWYKADNNGKYNVNSGYEDIAANAVSLTNNVISPNLNYLYGYEVEYILYGQSTKSENVTKAYGTIYLLRFALNTVYAFTDGEINSITTSAATALFGTPPLTPLIPIAKIAFTIGLALAESAYDLYLLKDGKAVPVYKSSDTWVMKPSTAAKVVVAEVAEDVAGKVVDEVVDEGSKMLTDILSKTDEEIQKMIDEKKVSIEDIADSAVTKTMNTFKDYADEALVEVVEICNDVNQQLMFDSDYMSTNGTFDLGPDKDGKKVEMVVTKLENWLAAQKDGSNDAVYEVKKMAVDYLTADNGKNIKDLLTEIADSATVAKDMSILDKKMNSLRTDINNKVDSLADDAASKLSSLKNDIVTSLEDSIDEGATELKKKLKGKISDAFGTSGNADSGSTNIVSSMLSWRYSDYLTLLLVIQNIKDQQSVLLRTADVIELNVQLINNEFSAIATKQTRVETKSRLFGLIKYDVPVEETVVTANDKAFKMKKAYTYLKINAQVQVKPLLMTMPLAADTVKSQLTGTDWYTVYYSATMGY